MVAAHVRRGHQFTQQHEPPSASRLRPFAVRDSKVGMETQHALESFENFVHLPLNVPGRV